jgi:hypothetical protein
VPRLLEYRIGAGLFGSRAMNPNTRAVLVGLIAISVTFAVVIGLYHAR